MTQRCITHMSTLRLSCVCVCVCVCVYENVYFTVVYTLGLFSTYVHIQKCINTPAPATHTHTPSKHTYHGKARQEQVCKDTERNTPEQEDLTDVSS